MSGESIGEGPMVCGVFLAKYKMCKESREIPDRLLTTIMAWSNARTCPQCLYGPYIIVIVLGAWIPVRIQGLKIGLSLSPSHGLRVSETDFLTMVIASEMFSRFHCCFGQDMRPNIRWVKARGQVSPWHPDGSAPEIAPASDARISYSDNADKCVWSENDSECSVKVSMTQDVARHPRRVLLEQIVVPIRSLSRSRWRNKTFSIWFRGLFCFCIADGNVKNPDSFSIKDGLVFNDLSKIWRKPELDHIAGARPFQ